MIHWLAPGPGQMDGAFWARMEAPYCADADTTKRMIERNLAGTRDGAGPPYEHLHASMPLSGMP